MSSYRVFIGDWSSLSEGAEPDWVHHDKPGLSWEEAQTFLNERLAGFETDDCEFCRADAAQERERLMKAQPGQFEAEVDGDDYVIIDESEGATS